MSLRADQGQTVKDLAVCDRLALEAAQVILRTLDLVAIKAVVDHGEVDPRGPVIHTHLADEAGTLLPPAKMDDQGVPDRLGVVHQSECELARGRGVPGSHDG